MGGTSATEIAYVQTQVCDGSITLHVGLDKSIYTAGAIRNFHRTLDDLHKVGEEIANLLHRLYGTDSSARMPRHVVEDFEQRLDGAYKRSILLQISFNDLNSQLFGV